MLKRARHSGEVDITGLKGQDCVLYKWSDHPDSEGENLVKCVLIVQLPKQPCDHAGLWDAAAWEVSKGSVDLAQRKGPRSSRKAAEQNWVEKMNLMSCPYNYTHVVPKAPTCNKTRATLSLVMLLPPNLFLCILHCSKWHRLPPSYSDWKPRCLLCDSWVHASTWLGCRIQSYLAKHDFWVFLWGCFSRRDQHLSWRWLDQSRWLSPKGVGTMPSSEGLNVTKSGGTLSLCCAWVLEWDIDLLLLSSLLVPRPWDSDWNSHPSSVALWAPKHTPGFPGPLACRQQIVGPLSLQSHVSQYLLITLFLYFTISIGQNLSCWFCFSGEPRLVQFWFFPFPNLLHPVYQQARIILPEYILNGPLLSVSAATCHPHLSERPGAMQ